MKKLSLFPIITFCYFLGLSQSFAGSGYYLGADYVRNYIKTSVKNSLIISPSITPTITSENQNENSNDYGLRFGYKHKISEYIYIAPEFFYNKINKSDYLYSTTMKAGVEFKDISVFGSLGYAENNYFNGNSENYGVGLEYKINDNFSLTSEYIKYGDINTNETSTSGIVTTNVKKGNQLQSIKFGITYYFHE